MTKINQRAQALAQPKTPTSKNAVKAPSENKTLVPQLEDRFDESYNPYFDDDQTPFQTAIIGTLASGGLGAIALVATSGIGGALFGVGAIAGLAIGIAINHSALFGERE